MNVLTPEDVTRLTVYAAAFFVGLFVMGLIGLARELRRQKIEQAARRTGEGQQTLAAMARKMAR